MSPSGKAEEGRAIVPDENTEETARQSAVRAATK